jgi:hypothetical protein
MNTHFVNKRLAHLLGCASLVPFVLIALACWVASLDWLFAFIKAQLAWGVLTFTFIGGIHWGATMGCPHLTADQTKRALGWSTVPPLLAWFSTMIGGFGFAVLMAGFVGAYHVDKRLYAWYRMPEWLIRLRFVLTCATVGAIALTVVAANVRG